MSNSTGVPARKIAASGHELRVLLEVSCGISKGALERAGAEELVTSLNEIAGIVLAQLEEEGQLAPPYRNEERWVAVAIAQAERVVLKQLGSVGILDELGRLIPPRA